MYGIVTRASAQGRHDRWSLHHLDVPVDGRGFGNPPVGKRRPEVADSSSERPERHESEDVPGEARGQPVGPVVGGRHHHDRQPRVDLGADHLGEPGDARILGGDVERASVDRTRVCPEQEGVEVRDVLDMDVRPHLGAAEHPYPTLGDRVVRQDVDRQVEPEPG
jgi:hypothetical protein